MSGTRMTTLLSYFLSYLPLMVKATMPSILNTIRNIFMRLYGSVEEVVTIFTRRLLCSYSCALTLLPHPPPKNNFLEFDSLSKTTN